MSLQAGTQALTKDNQLVTIVGFSDKWQEPTQLAAADQTVLKNLSLRMNLSDIESNIVALYYDP